MRIVREPSAEGTDWLFKGKCDNCLAIITAYRGELSIERLDEKEKEVAFKFCPCCKHWMTFYAS